MRSRLIAVRSDELLARNIRALLNARRIDDSALAAWCGHKPAWLSKILTGNRGLRIKELGKIADFFGIEVAQLFQYGIDPLLERRRHERRTHVERRTGLDRRQAPEVRATSHQPEDDIDGAPARLPLDPSIAVAQRLTVLAEQLESLAAEYLARHAAALGDSPAGDPEGDPEVRRDERRPRPRKTG